MKNTEILTSVSKTEIDWGKPMWVISEDNMIVLTTGEYGDLTFTGICLPCPDYIQGEYSQVWEKDSFKPIQDTLTIKISN